MNRDITIALLTGVIAGFVAGFLLANNRTTQPVAQVQSPLPPGPAAPSAAGSVDAYQRIQGVLASLALDPKNAKAWISLGNDYFDTHQPQKAVEAYDKALELEPKGAHVADVLTDQGIMYRELKAFDKAMANFKKANKANPGHVQSVFNLGIVCYQDLKDLPTARQAFTRVIEMAPASTQAEQATSLLAAMAGGKS
ncbi:tetratricopeptide repeat protein [Mesoterricola silvestris]|uniref:Tetratricopeptide repeat protein n=1 Tax=Mesoterricola silvestris TaxID=2927979 RepID=A0AA48GSF7_9BACT|nr:tetratricopeptide repeat protein [Mesoterricola silvestris]BDU73157.1 hypothetical protein METEAL_23310 [Mesoterricola silvestris]